MAGPAVSAQLVEALSSGVIISVLLWMYLDNRTSHRDIYEKLHQDHKELQVNLRDLWKHLAGRDKE